MSSSSMKLTGLAASIENTKATYKQLGKSGLLVSVPILGAMSFGRSSWGKWVLDEDEALPILKAAYDAGVNTWDTANNYSNGGSEIVIGKAIKKYNIPRHKLLIFTKLWSPVSEHEDSFIYQHFDALRGSKDYVNQFGLSRSAIFNSVEASLKRLDTSYIDLLQIHRFDPYTPIEETMSALNDLVRSGKVRYIGASSMWTYQFAKMQFVAEKNGWEKFVSMQCRYSLLWREEEREMLRYCKEEGVGVIPWRPVDGGLLARPLSQTQAGSTLRGDGSGHDAISSKDQEIIKRVEELAEKKGWSMTHVALAWVNKRVSSPIIGVSSVDRLNEALGARGKELSEEEERYLEAGYRAKLVTGFL